MKEFFFFLMDAIKEKEKDFRMWIKEDFLMGAIKLKEEDFTIGVKGGPLNARCQKKKKDFSCAVIARFSGHNNYIYKKEKDLSMGIKVLFFFGGGSMPIIKRNLHC